MSFPRKSGAAIAAYKVNQHTRDGKAYALAIYETCKEPVAKVVAMRAHTVCRQRWAERVHSELCTYSNPNGKRLSGEYNYKLARNSHLYSVR